MPDPMVSGLPRVLPRVEEFLVVFHFEVGELYPHARRVERVDVRRKTPVRVDEVVADVLRIRDGALGVVARFAEICLPAARVAIRSGERGDVAVRAAGAVL